MALTKDRNTPYKDPEIMVVALAAGTVAFAGGMAVINENGFAEPGKTATGLTYIGRFEQHIDNSAGIDGAASVEIRRGKMFKFKNSAAEPITQANVAKPCYIVDDETVAATDGGGTRSMAGKVCGFDAGGVWVY